MVLSERARSFLLTAASLPSAGFLHRSRPPQYPPPQPVAFLRGVNSSSSSSRFPLRFLRARRRSCCAAPLGTCFSLARKGAKGKEDKREFLGGKETDGRGIELQNAMVKQSFAFRAEIENMAACSFSPSGIDRAAVKPAISTFARLADGLGKNVFFLQAGNHKFQPSSSSL